MTTQGDNNFLQLINISAFKLRLSLWNKFKNLITVLQVNIRTINFQTTFDIFTSPCCLSYKIRTAIRGLISIDWSVICILLFFFNDLLWSRFMSRTIYLMLSTSIVFCLRLFSLSSSTTSFPQCRQSSVFFCVLSVFYSLSSPPSWRNTCPISQLSFLCCIVLRLDFSLPIIFRTSSFVIFTVQLIFGILPYKYIKTL